jgi:hypothetical protein
MRIAHSSIVRSLITLVIAGCGDGSGLIGIATGGGGGGQTAQALAFFVPPNSATAGQAISPPVEVVAKDSLGNTDSTFTGGVTVSLASNPAGGSLSGTTTTRAVAGIASFSGLVIDKPGTYTLSASTSGVTPVTSNAFTVTTATGP